MGGVKELVKPLFAIGKGSVHVLHAETRRSLCTKDCPRQVYSADDPRACIQQAARIGYGEGEFDPDKLCARCRGLIFRPAGSTWGKRLAAYREYATLKRVGTGGSGRRR